MILETVITYFEVVFDFDGVFADNRMIVYPS